MVTNIITYAVKDLVDLGIIEKPLDGNHGGIHPKSSDYVEYGIPFIMASDLINGHVDIKGCKFISEEQAKSLRKGFAKEGDVLLSHKATIGRTAVVGRLSTDFIVLTPQITYYRVLDLTRLNPRYLKYYFDSEGFQALFEQWAGGGSTRLYLGITEQMKLPIELPEIKIQNKIVDLVDSFDLKITLNRQINQTLEQMAQALFKSWFVDFDPVVDNALDAGFFEQDLEFSDELLCCVEARKAVRENADFKPLPENIRQLFPAAFEECIETSLGLGGWVPEGWGTLTLSEISKIASGKRPPTKGTLKTKEEPVPVWGGNGIKWFTDRPLSTDRYVITGRVGTLGTVYKVNGPSWASDNALTIRPLRNEYFEFVYQVLSNFDINSLNSGSTQPLVTQTALGNIQFVFPSNTVLFGQFQKHIDTYDKKTTVNCTEVETLTNLRDTLLPKLISGELRLSDSEVDTADEVLA